LSNYFDLLLPLTLSAPIRSGTAGTWWMRRLDAHHITLVFAALSCMRLQISWMTVQALHQLLTCLSCLRSHTHSSLCRPTYRRRHEQDKYNIAKGSASRCHTYTVLLLIFRKSLIVLIANFFPRLPTLVILYTIYSLPKPLHTVLTVSEKDNIITGCLILTSLSIKTSCLIN